MYPFFITILSLIFLETTYLAVKTSKKTFAGSNQKRKVYVDTSAIMDGRILAVAETGFIGDDLIIPRSVIREMQLLADGHDSEKRSRARIGLDTINALERVVHCNVTILQDKLDRTPVDERLLELAKENKGVILTNDFNLGKVAATEHIEVLNINDLSLALSAEYSAGDRITVRINSEGSGPKQGVGYLPEGIMVVIDGASNLIGQEVEAEVTRFLQNSAGRMIFAKIKRSTRRVNTSSRR